VSSEVRNPLETAGFFIDHCPRTCYEIPRNPEFLGVTLARVTPISKQLPPKREETPMPKKTIPLSDIKVRTDLWCVNENEFIPFLEKQNILPLNEVALDSIKEKARIYQQQQNERI
jgi:hypothetical protein